MKEELPDNSFSGIVRYWKYDLPAAISVSLVALPLGLGIAVASGVPPMSGVLAAIIGGLVTTFFRSSYVAINGPAAGLIVVVLAGVESLSDANGSGFRYVLAAIVIAGLIQMILGLLKMGKLGDSVPTAVISGMLASIGITIFAKQFHIAVGNDMISGSTLDTLLEIPQSIVHLNPWITLISVVSLIILILHPRITNKFFKSIPAPLQVMAAAILITFLINFWGSEDLIVLGEPFYISSSYLVHIPDNLLDNIIFPDFSKIKLPEFWLVVVSITLVASIETLISTKGVDKLDHYKRRTDLNKDLFAVGLSTAISGFLGGLPIITVIVRSSVNVNHNAKTKWSNFYHGLVLLALVVLFPFIIREIALASLASILVYTGYKLAAPRVFKTSLMKGWEQLFILLITMFCALAIDLLWGIIIGIIATLILHWLRSGLHITTFSRHLIHTEIDIAEESNEIVHVDIKGIANFAILMKLIKSLQGLGKGKTFIVNFSRTKLIDSTVLEFIHEHREKYFTDTKFEFVGMDVHKTSSAHPMALHVLERPMQKRLTSRQNDLSHFATEYGYTFRPAIDWEVKKLEKFKFFKFHLLEYHRNRLLGSFKSGVNWEIEDITYSDGVLIAREQHHITGMIMHFAVEFKEFSITKENTRHLKTLSRAEMSDNHLPDDFLNLVSFLSDNASFYIEGANREVFIYRKERLLSAKEIIELHDFAKSCCEILPNSVQVISELQAYLR